MSIHATLESCASRLATMITGKHTISTRRSRGKPRPHLGELWLRLDRQALLRAAALGLGLALAITGLVASLCRHKETHS